MLRLALADPSSGRERADLVDPFLALGDRGTFSRTLLGAVVGPQGTPVLEVAVKLQSDDYPLLSEGAGITNAHVERSWQREAQLVDRVPPVGSGLPVPVEVLSRRPGEPGVLPPTIFCKRREAFFASVCPECGGPLADVRDDRLLEERGLERREGSLARFVGCRACLADGREARLWTLMKDEGQGPDVGDQAHLFVSLGRLARREGRILPCQGCEHVPTCYPEDERASPEVLRCLTPVTFYESRALAFPLLHLRYDECAALIGGATVSEIVAQVGEPGRAAVLGRVAEALALQPAYLFGHDAAGKLGLEVLRLKLALFAQLCRATTMLHRHGREPHLGITPARAMAAIGEEPGGLPWLWRLAVRLVGLGNAFVRQPPVGTAADLPVPSFARPRLVDPVFAAPALREAPRADLPGTLTPRRISPLPDGRVVVEADVEADSIDLADVGEKDTIDLSVVQGRPPLSLVIVALPAGREERTLRVRSAPLSLDASARETLTQLIGQPLTRARLTIHPCLHVPADVHSLGMILLVSLLAHPGRPAAEVARAVDDVRERLALAARHRPQGDGGVLVEQAGRLLATDPFAKRNLFARPAEREEAAAAIPDDVWMDALLVGLRAVTTLRGLSVCRSPADFDPGHPEVKVEFLLQLVDGLIRRVDAALFGLPGRAREIRAAVARVAREFKVE